MTRLVVSSREQISFGREVLQHRGIKPGDETESELCRMATQYFVGLLAGRSLKIASIEEISAAAAEEGQH